MWKFILLCCCLLNSLFLFALEENVTFHSSFEGTIQAEKALGSPQCVNRRDARYSEPGISGKALRLQAGEFLRYKQHRNFNPEQGTVCFWMRPVDWDPAAPTPGYMWLMSIAGDTAEGGHVQIFKMPSPMMMGYVGNYPQVKEITHSTEDWKKGEWVFLALCWERGRMTFYRNGKILGKTTLDETDLPRDTGDFISLDNAFGTTDFDEFTIYNCALSDSEVENLYLANVPGNSANSFVYRPRIEIGNDTGNWDDAAAMEGFLNIPELEMQDGTSLRVKYSDDALLFRLETPVENAPAGKWQKPAEVSLQTLWTVPSAEFFLWTDSADTADVYQIAFNLFNQQMTFLNSRPAKWEAEVSGQVEGDKWIAEVRIPFRSLGTATPAPGTVWHFNAGRNFLNPNYFANPALSLAYGDNSNAWELVFGSVPARSYALRVSDDGTVTAEPLNSAAPDSGSARIYLKKLANEQLQLNSVLRTPGAAQGIVVAEAAESALKLPGPGRYLAVLSGTDEAGRENFRQLFHFQRRKPFEFHCEFFSQQQKMDLVWNLDAPADREMTLHGIIRDSAGNELATQDDEIRPGMRSGRMKFSMAGWTALDCRAELTMTDGSRQETRTMDFQCFYNAPWIGFEQTLNMAETLPPPWIPIQTGERTLTTLTQKYEFGENGLPTQIIVTGQPLLAAPVLLTMPGFRLIRPMAFTRRSDVSCEWESVFESDSLVATLKGTAEFDGMLRYDLSLRPKNQNARLTTLQLTVPVAKENGQYFLPYAGPYQKWNMLDIPTDASRPYSDAFMPHLWVGGNTCGVAWFSESDEFYFPVDEAKVVRVIPDEESTSMFIDMVGQSLQIAEPICYTFGLQATPAKPLPENWGSYHLAGCDSTLRRPILSMGYTTGPEYHKYAGLPYPTKDDERALEFVRTNRESPGIQTLIYTTSNGIGGKCPEFQFFEEEWKNSLFCDTWSMAGRGEYHWGTNPASQTWRDFFLWSCKNAIDRFAPSGFYYDFGSVVQVDNPAGGCGYTRDGKRRPTWPIFADRAMRRAVYQMVMDKNGSATFVSHNYSQMVCPVVSFFTVILDGEPYQQRTGVIGIKTTMDYTKLIPLSRLKTMFGHQFGTIPYLLVKLPVDSTDSAEICRATRTALALTAPHGVPVWGFYCDIQELNKLLAIQDEFDLSDARFVPYYAPERQLKLDPEQGEQLLLSYWEKPDGRKLAVIGNLTDEFYNGKMITQDGRSVPVSVPAKDYITLEVR